MSFNPDDFKVECTPLSMVTVNGNSVEWDKLSPICFVATVEGKWIILGVNELTAEIQQHRQTHSSVNPFVDYGDINRVPVGELLDVIDGNITLPVDEAVEEIESVELKLNTLIDVSVKDKLYCIEEECGYCGAPRGVRKTTLKVWDAAPTSNKHLSFTNVTDDELLRIYNIDSDDVDGVLSVYCTCSGCQSYEL